MLSSRGVVMAVKGRFHKLDDKKKQRITGRSGRLFYVPVKRDAKVAERVTIKSIVNDLNNDEED